MRNPGYSIDASPPMTPSLISSLPPAPLSLSSAAVYMAFLLHIYLSQF